MSNLFEKFIVSASIASVVVMAVAWVSAPDASSRAQQSDATTNSGAVAGWTCKSLSDGNTICIGKSTKGARA